MSSVPVRDIRREVLAARKALTLESVNDLSERVASQLVHFCKERWSAKDWHQGILGNYRVPDGNSPREVDPKFIIAHPYFCNASFAYPRVTSIADGTLEMVLVGHPSDWRTGVFGLTEPRPELPGLAPKELHAILCPGVVFDKRGGRAGFGRGFYDRYLVRAPGAIRIGLAFDFQVRATELSLEPHDQKMDVIITESRILTFGQRSSIPGLT